jgi:hypothetical protein
MYTVRFFVEQVYVEESIDVKGLSLLPINTTLHNTQILYYDLKTDSIWFECELPFIPTIGMQLCDIHTKGFYWEENGLPTVSNVKYSFKHKLFIVELEWWQCSYMRLLGRIYSQTKKDNLDA